MTEQIHETPVLEIKEYRYQPTDEDNRPIGGIQVIKYTTQDELAEKLREQNVLLIRKLRQETKKGRLGILEDEVLPDDIKKFDGFTEFNPRDFTDDERVELSRKLLDPTTAFDAVNTIMEARIGAPVDVIGKKVNTLEQENLTLRAKIEANAFLNDNPDYYRCQENFEAICAWMNRYNLAPVKANYQKAYDTLKAHGVLILGAGIPVEQPVVTPPVAEQPVTVEQPVRGIASGFNNEDSSSTGPVILAGSDITYELTIGGTKRVLTGLKAIQAMPSDEYKRRILSDKEFAKKVDRLEAEARRKG